MVAYVAVYFEMRHSEGSSNAFSPYNIATCTNSSTVKAPHRCLEHCMKRLKKAAIFSVSAITSNDLKCRPISFCLRTLETYLKLKTYEVKPVFSDRNVLSYQFCNEKKFQSCINAEKKNLHHNNYHSAKNIVLQARKQIGNLYSTWFQDMQYLQCSTWYFCWSTFMWWILFNF